MLYTSLQRSLRDVVSAGTYGKRYRPVQRQRRRRRPQLELDPAHALQAAAMVVDRVPPRADVGAVCDQTVEVDVRQHQRRLVAEARALGQSLAVLVDQRLAVPGQIGGRFASPGSRVEVGAERARRMRGAERAAIVGLADGGVAGRKVGEHGRACQRPEGAGRDRRPEVLADLDVQRQVGHVTGAEQQVGAERHNRRADGDLITDRVAGRAKLALLVELAVLRQEALGHHAEDHAAVNHDRGVEQPLLSPQRCADDDHRHQVDAGQADLFDRGRRRLDQRVLPKEVLAGIGGQSQLREYDDGGARVGRLAGQRQCAPGVGLRIADTHGRDGSRQPHVAVAVERLKGKRGLRDVGHRW
jgi:hypothetical protein